MDKFIGKRLDGRYEISELIGVGGMAVVYKAYDNIDDRVVAIKILKEEFLANDEFRRRFKNESKAIAVLSHPNIVKVYDVSFGDVLQYIVMEYIDGITLKKYIEQQGIIEWKEAIHFTSQILKALEHAHEKGIIHRDIKPQNIMLLPNGTIKVTDFGIARFSRSEQRTITNKAIGSVHYISPEQARGDFTDGRADIYSVGVMLYEMTTGRVPFQADSAVSVAIMQLQNEPVSPTEINSLIPKGLEEITLKAMKKDAINRFDTASEMLDELSVVYDNPNAVFSYRFENVVAVQDSGKAPERKSRKKKYDDDSRSNVIPILSGIALVFVAVIIIAGVFIVRAMNAAPGAEFSCPDLVGKNYEQIIKSEQYKDYNIVKSEESAYNADYKAGYIYKQSPEKNTKIKQASEILVYVSLGAKKVELKDYANMDYNTVKEELEDDGLKVVRTDLPSSDIRSGAVISSNPAPNSVVRTGDTITLYVSAGEDAVVISTPDVSGMDADAAKKYIEEKGFKYGGVSEKQYSDTVPEGCVVSQYPSGKAALGSAISVVLSKGKRPPTTTAPQTTVGDTTVSINIPLPKDYNSTATFEFYLGIEQVKSVKLNLKDSGDSGYKMDISGMDTETFSVQVDGQDYIVYLVDFKNKSVSITEGPYTLKKSE